MISANENIFCLTGKFHVHLTVDTDTMTSLHSWKHTSASYHNYVNQQVDWMFTKHYMIPSGKCKTVEQMIEDIQSAVATLNARGTSVVRTKIEHESWPSVPISESQYHECHIKLKVRSAHEISNVGLPPNFVFSTNPFTGDLFLNARFREGTTADVANVVGKVLVAIPHLYYEVKTEMVIFDDNPAHDSWWA